MRATTFFLVFEFGFFLFWFVWLMPTAVHGRLLALGLRAWAAWHRSRVELRNKYGYEMLRWCADLLERGGEYFTRRSMLGLQERS